MRPITKLTMFAFAASAIAAPAFAATNMYLELGPIKGESTDRRLAGGKVQLSSFTFSASRKGWDGTIKPVLSDVEGGRAAGEESAAPDSMSVGVGRGIVVGKGGDAATTAPRDSPSGMPTGKRQHGSVTITKALDRGSVTVHGNLPGCTVGAAYADAVLQTPAMRYELKEVMISSCTVSGSTGGGDAPTESVTLDYASYRESPTRRSEK